MTSFMAVAMGEVGGHSYKITGNIEIPIQVQAQVSATNGELTCSGDTTVGRVIGYISEMMREARRDKSIPILIKIGDALVSPETIRFISVAKVDEIDNAEVVD